MSAAGLGLRLHDLLYQSDYQPAFDQWWEHARSSYLHVDELAPERLTMYYDPLLDHHHELPRAGGGLGVSLYLLPQRPEAARRLFDWTAEAFGWTRPGPTIVDAPGSPRGNLVGMVMAAELGLDDLLASFRTFADEHWQPSWDRERGELTWSFGFDEPHPRGQYNATLALAEALRPGEWSRLYNDTGSERLRDPEVVGVDFPDLLLSRAQWLGDAGRLELSTVPRAASVEGRPTSFAVARLPAGRRFRVLRDGEPWSKVRRGDDGRLHVDATIGRHDYRIEPDPIA